MKKLILLAVVVVALWQGYNRYWAPRIRAPEQPQEAARTGLSGSTDSPFKCDGRIYCSQMTSCAEATYFLRNCPGTKMDGNNDGIPCERQWCK